MSLLHTGLQLWRIGQELRTMMQVRRQVKIVKADTKRTLSPTFVKLPK
jgi:hypothetical protein